VWLIDRIPAQLQDGLGWSLLPPEPVVTFMREVEALRREPDSLLLAVRAIQEQMPRLAGI
ncbi:hypothetical protein ABTM24_20355, partial [Acinetobacter baumannii]